LVEDRLRREVDAKNARALAEIDREIGEAEAQVERLRRELDAPATQA
jgi:HAMP domain-containing protein